MEKSAYPVHLLPYFIISLFSMELLFRYTIDIPIFSMGTVISLLFISFFSIILSILCRIFRPTINYILSIIVLLLTAIIYSSQFIYYKFFKTFYTVYSAKRAGQVTEFWEDILQIIYNNLLIILLFFIPVILILIFGKRYINFSKIMGYRILVALSAASLLYIADVMLIQQTGKEANSAYDLYYNSSSPVLSVNRLGLLTTMRLDLQRQITGWSPVYAKPVGIEPDLSDNQPEKEVPDKNPPQKGEDPGPVVYVDQVMDIDFDSLIQQETNSVIKDMHQYFKAVKPTKTNEYTGKFSGYNLIFITAEGFSHLAIHKDITPTLYKLANEGYQFPNFYTPIWGVSTSDGEYVATQSLIPKSGVWSFFESGNNELPFVMGNQFNKSGYKTVAYHNHTYDYYRRDVSHPNMGYDYKGVGNGLVIKETWPESDIEMMEVTTSEYINEEHFHAYYMTVSGHMLYNFTGNYIAYKNRGLVEDLTYSNEARAYFATQIELDRAIEHLLNELEKAGIADRTLIALSADHYPYGLEKETIDELEGHEVEENFELYKNAFILYAKGMEPVVIDKPASSLDILPTLSNLLGLEYDSRLLMGRDLFSDAEGLVIFQNKSFITEKGKYNSVTNQFLPNDGVEVGADYVKQMNNVVNGKFYYSTQILDQNYYKKVFTANN